MQLLVHNLSASYSTDQFIFVHQPEISSRILKFDEFDTCEMPLWPKAMFNLPHAELFVCERLAVSARRVDYLLPLVSFEYLRRLSGHSIFSVINMRLSTLLAWLLSLSQQLFYHVNTIYLFIRSDIKTILLPVVCIFFFLTLVADLTAFQTAFALIVTPSIHLRGILLVTLWVLVHLLLIDIDNQSLSVEEDANNKPWRPLPSGRLSIWTAHIISRALYPACIIFSYISGGLSCAITSAGFTALVYIYDHLGANKHWIWRNVVNAFAYTALETGASLLLGIHL